MNCCDCRGNYPKTISELQADLNQKDCKYNIMDVTALQMAGYGNGDKFKVKSNGTIVPYENKYRVTDTLWAALESTGLTFGFGYGLGLSMGIEGVEFEGIMKFDVVNFSFSPSTGFDIGQTLDASLSALGITIWEEVEYRSEMDSAKSYSTIKGNGPDIRELALFEGYLIIGANLNVTYNFDYLKQRKIYKIKSAPQYL